MVRTPPHYEQQMRWDGEFINSMGTSEYLTVDYDAMKPDYLVGHKLKDMSIVTTDRTRLTWAERQYRRRDDTHRTIVGWGERHYRHVLDVLFIKHDLGSAIELILLDRFLATFCDSWLDYAKKGARRINVDIDAIITSFASALFLYEINKFDFSIRRPEFYADDNMDISGLGQFEYSYVTAMFRCSAHDDFSRMLYIYNLSLKRRLPTSLRQVEREDLVTDIIVARARCELMILLGYAPMTVTGWLGTVFSCEGYANIYPGNPTTWFVFDADRIYDT